MEHSTFDRKALEVTILADTVYLSKSVTFTNIKIFNVTTRKFITGIYNNGGDFLQLGFEIIAKAQSWTKDTALPPDLNSNGNDGQRGADGFRSTEFSLNTGCLTGLVTVIW